MKTVIKSQEKAEVEFAVAVKKVPGEDCPAGVFIDRTEATRQVTRRKIFRDLLSGESMSSFDSMIDS